MPKQEIVTLTDWRYMEKPQNLWQSSELKQLYLVGTCTNHPKFADGNEIRTSIIVGKRNDLVETKEGYLVFLKEPNKEWAKRFPDSEAKEHLLSILTEID